MSTMIKGAECMACGDCEPVCPVGAIKKSARIFEIDPTLCTECVGFFNTEQCNKVCPVSCCYPDPNNTETEEVLFERAMKMHANADKPPRLSEETSHFQRPSRKWWRLWIR